MADKNRVELPERGAVAFELKQLREICAHVAPIDSAAAFSHDSLDIEPVLGAVGKGLEDDQCGSTLCRARAMASSLQK